MLAAAVLLIVLRCAFGATGTDGWLGAAKGGKSCADERPGGSAVESDELDGPGGANGMDFVRLLVVFSGLMPVRVPISRGPIGDSGEDQHQRYSVP